jgi:hypothetical protein
MASIQKQPYVSWKGNVWGVINGVPEYKKTVDVAVPSYSRPSVNGASDNAQDYISPFGKARPLKLYRKRLIPQEDSGKSSATIGQVMERPGVTVYLGGTTGQDCAICADASNSVLSIKQYYGFTNDCNRCYKESCGDASGNPFRCTRSTEGHIGYRPVSTILNKEYYASNSSYLRSRSRTYQQNLSVNPANGITYEQDGKLLFPTDAPNGPQVYDTGTCENTTRTCNQTIYKPNNRKFMVQGAVSSSSRIERLKHDTEVSVDNSWRNSSPYMQDGSGETSKKYTATCVNNLPNRPMFDNLRIKSGNPSSCFITPVANLYHQSKTTDIVYSREN